MTGKLRARILQCYHAPMGRVLLSLAMTAAALAAFTLVQQITYLTNDDNAIAFTLAGYHTGEPWPYALFTNCIVGYVVSGLYAALPGVAWWAALQIIAIGLSCTAIGSVLLREGAKREAPLLVPLGVYGSLLLLLILQPFIELTYTVSAAILGAAGAALTLTSADEESGRMRATLDILGLLAVVVAFLIREETGFALLPFYAAACLYRALLAVGGFALARQRAVASACVLLAAAALLCGGAFLFNTAMHARVNGNAYETFFRYRERFTDYPRPTYDEAPELYASVGWDETVYALADGWCFLDARIDGDALKTVTDAGENDRPTLAEAARMCVDTVDRNVPTRLIVAATLLFFCMGLFSWQRSRRRWPSFALMAALLLGAALLCLYLCMRGRFPLRTFRVVAIPATTLCAVLAMRMYAPKADRQGRLAQLLATALLAVTAIAAGLLSAKSLRVNSPKHLLSDSRAVYAYALSHPGNVYIRDTFVLNDVDAFSVFPEEKPVNLISWGGCEMRSAESERQFSVNDLVARDAGIFAESGVYFVTRADSTEHAILFDYLTKWRGASGMELVEMITDEIAVYEVTY